MTPGRTTATTRDYWICQLAGWTSLTAVSIFSSSHGDPVQVLRFAMAKTACMVTGLGLSHLWRNYLKRRDWLHSNKPLPLAGIVAALALLALVETALLFLFDFVFRKGALVDDPVDLPYIVVGLIILWFGIFLIWTLCYAFVLSRGRALRFELEKLELEVNVKDAELRALQAQINPHFFFNSLNSIRALIYQDADAAAGAVGQLAGMMRHSLRAGQADTVRLADELAAVDAYLGMEKLRFEERLHLTRDIAAGLDEVAIPPMALQTLVENAVKHGVEPSAGVCRLSITAVRAGGDVVLGVANQGRLAAASASTRLGLANTSKRLVLLFGPRASCTLAERDGWVEASIVLPQERP